MRYTNALVGCAIVMLSAARLCASPQDTHTITLVNYTAWPVHATAVTVDAKTFGGPVRVRRADTGVAVPLTHGADGISLYVSLPPTSRLDLVTERVDKCAEAIVVEAKEDELANGILRFSFEKRGWRLGFAADKASLIEDGALDFWVDTQNRGRISNGDTVYVKQLGLARFADAPLEKSEASVSMQGCPTITHVRHVGAMKVTESFELVPGMPLLICRVQWKNEGDTPLWVAYVGSGNGVYGRWSKELMQGPLIERKKSPVQGDINGSETRCAWLGGLCRISMESLATGCGVGMSTLLPTPGKVGQGSMIWGCGYSGFQCNFIDPVQGQFPFLVKPGEALDNGFVFLASQTGSSVFRETVELWKALQTGQLPALQPPCAVFVDREPVAAQTVGGVENRAEAKLALRLDFNKRFECRVAGSCRLVARPLASGKKPVVVLETQQAGTHAVDLNQRLGWSDEVAFVLEKEGAAPVSVAETLPVSPTMLSPVPDAQMTDLAAMFRWAAIAMVTEYHVQWARSPDFAAPAEAHVTSSQEYPWHLVPDGQLPAPGCWYWRIRGVKGDVLGAWSETRAFTVDSDRAKRPLRRPLTPERPLFTLEASKVLSFTNFVADVPADLAPYVGIIAEGFEGKGIPVTEFAKGLERLPHAVLLRSHWVGLADIEWLFQHVPNVVGIQGGEHLSSLSRDNKDGDMRYHHRLTRLCAKYGMFYQEADGTYKDDKWQDLMDQQGAFVREYGPWLVLSQKNNIIRRQFYSQSAALGLWLGGITHQHGAWEDGGFYWQNAGFGELGQCVGERSGVLKTMPRIFWDLVFVLGVARGCGIYSLDGQTLMVSPKEIERFPKDIPRAVIWKTTGETTEVFKRHVVPLIRGVVKHQLIPTRDEVLKNVRLAVYNDMKGKGDVAAWPHYAEYGPLFAGTYGFGKMGNIDGQLWEFFPNTGRYYFVPFLPQGNEPLGPAVANVPVSELQKMDAVKRRFDAAYPAWYAGDAWACRSGDTLAVMNANENADAAQRFDVPLRAGLVQRVSGIMEPHSYLVGKVEEEGKRLWLQLNGEYADRAQELHVTCSRKPQWQVEPAAATLEQSWDEAAKALRLRLSFKPGAVEVTVK